jgi:hypothetical protein
MHSRRGNVSRKRETVVRIDVVTPRGTVTVTRVADETNMEELSATLRALKPNVMPYDRIAFTKLSEGSDPPLPDLPKGTA